MSTPTRKIAYVIDDLSYGGAQKQLTMLARALPDRYVPIVIALSELTMPFAGLLRQTGVEVHELPRGPRSQLGRLTTLTRTLRAARADVVHGFLDAANAYAYLSARLLRKPVVLSVQNEKLRLEGLKAAVLSRALRRADYVTVNSSAGEQFLLRETRVPRGKLALIQNWIDLEEAAGAGEPRDLPPPGAPPVIGNVGRFARQKGLHLLVEAFAAVRRVVPDAKLVLMGEGDEREALVAQVERLGMSEHVEFVEPDVNVMGTLRRLHCLVMPSAFEGLPNTAIEALSVGVPVIASPVGDMTDIIIDGVTGMVMRSDDPHDIAKTIVAALSDEQLVQNARIEGPRLVARRFSMTAALANLITIYERVMRDEPVTPANEKGRA